MTRVTYQDRLKYARAANPPPTGSREERLKPYSKVDSFGSPMDIDTPTVFKTLASISTYIFGSESLTPANALGFTPHIPVRTADGAQVMSNSRSPPTLVLPLVHCRGHAVSGAIQSLNQRQPPNPDITAETRSLLELFSTDEKHRRNAVIVGSGQPVTVEAARVRRMLISVSFKSAAMTCECFECGGAFLIEGGCFWKSETL
ncbi:hypothetical protein DFP73DRAFT_591996 [Morchella snyderi]|nr:hypothetical protein DFP73DRAFT_591996 [Morchella snyderi]